MDAHPVSTHSQGAVGKVCIGRHVAGCRATALLEACRHGHDDCIHLLKLSGARWGPSRQPPVASPRL
jgi:hypothetical protein